MLMFLYFLTYLLFNSTIAGRSYTDNPGVVHLFVLDYDLMSASLNDMVRPNCKNPQYFLFSITFSAVYAYQFLALSDPYF